ncbi:MAG TPA: glycoside hydrolase family 2 protein, partial [Mobilitalea sp.]|nr:glycoside hydrolase family 2 protein [Mobilitalea sp.]
MLHQTLNGNWKMREAAGSQWLEAKVPGSVMSALLANDETSDPFWRMNEYQARELFRKDFEFQREFTISRELYEHDYIELICYGLDTLAEIYLNDLLLAKTNNMHRTWKFECKSMLNPGDNQIKIILRAPITYIESYQPAPGKEIHYTPSGGMAGNQYLRKTHCMFGWDWGAQIPDAGIWRDIELVGYTEGNIEAVEIIQHHGNNFVELEINTVLDVINPGAYSLRYTLSDPKGAITECTVKAHNGRNEYSIPIKQPELWWPNGYGRQPLYHLDVKMVKEDEVLDGKEFTLGLRTLTINQEKDEWGS